jgi:flagellar basal body-associated protein FliL
VATLTGGSSGFIDFAVAASDSATADSVTISASASATEEITGRGLAAGPSTLDIVMQTQASVSITTLTVVTGNGTYIAGQTFVVRVGFLNSGGTAASLSATLTFGESHLLSTNRSATIVLQASGTGTIDFLVTASLSSPTGNITIGATLAGSEAISGRSISGNQGLLSTSVRIEAGAVLHIFSIQLITGNGTYAPGNSFILRVTLNNTGSTPAYAVSVSITFGTYAGLSITPAAAITVPASGNAYQDINITVLSTATSATATLAFNWTGTEAVTGRSLSGGAVTGTFTIYVKVPSKPGPSLMTIVIIIVIAVAVVGIVAAVVVRGAKKKKTVQVAGPKSQPGKMKMPDYWGATVPTTGAAVRPTRPAESPAEPAQEGAGEAEPTEEARERTPPEENAPSTETAAETTGDNADITIVEDALVSLFEQHGSEFVSKTDAVQSLVRAGYTMAQADVAFENLRLAGRIVFKGQAPRGWMLK